MGTIAALRAPGAAVISAMVTGRLKRRGASTAGVEIEDAIAEFLRRLVRVAVDDRGDASRSGADVEIGDGVDKVKVVASQLDHFGSGEQAAGGRWVSMLPRIAVTGAIWRSASRISMLPMSPACRM